MSEQVQLRRGNTAQNVTFVGAQAELTVDTDQNKLILHDGVTTGGSVLASEAFVLGLTSGNVATIESQISSITANIGLIRANDIIMSGNIASLSPAVTTNSLNITTLQGNVVTINSAINDLQGNKAAIYDKNGTLSDNRVFVGSTQLNGNNGVTITLPVIYTNLNYKVYLTYTSHIGTFDSGNVGVIYSNIVSANTVTLYSTTVGDVNYVNWSTLGSIAQ
jgi:hypothetical protein